MTTERTKEIKSAAFAAIAEISDRGYTLEEMTAYISYIEILSTEIMNDAKKQTKINDYLSRKTVRKWFGIQEEATTEEEAAAKATAPSNSVNIDRIGEAINRRIKELLPKQSFKF